MHAYHFPSVYVLYNDILESYVGESAVVGNHHSHCPGIDRVVLPVLKHYVVVKPDVRERYSPGFRPHNHIMGLVRPEDAVAHLYIIDIELRKGYHGPDISIGVRAVGGCMGSHIFRRGIEGLYGDIVIIVPLECVFHEDIPAAYEVHPVGIHYPAYLLYVVYMDSRTPGNLDGPVGGVPQHYPLYLQVVAIEEFHLRETPVTVVFLRGAENAPAGNGKVVRILRPDPGEDDSPFIYIDCLVASGGNQPHIVHSRTKVHHILP